MIPSFVISDEQVWACADVRPLWGGWRCLSGPSSTVSKFILMLFSDPLWSCSHTGHLVRSANIGFKNINENASSSRGAKINIDLFSLFMTDNISTNLNNHERSLSDKRFKWAIFKKTIAWFFVWIRSDVSKLLSKKIFVHLFIHCIYLLQIQACHWRRFFFFFFF